jgi:S1-C subfamily serine protease
VLRYRVYAQGASVYKSVRQVLSDCRECAEQDNRPLWAKAPSMLRDMLTGLATQTSRRFRLLVVAGFAALALVIGFQSVQTRDLEERLAREQQRVAGLADLLERAQSRAITRAELAELQENLAKGLVAAGERVAALEARSAAARRIIAQHSSSVVLVQGGFGFLDPKTRRPLRMVAGAGGEPMRLPSGRPLVTLEGEGPPVEVNFTGTAFVVDAEGLLLSNRHVAMPWEDERSLPDIKALGLKPVMRRLIGYTPDSHEPTELKLLGSSKAYDLALMRATDAARLGPPLRLATSPPQPGDEVILLGYPTGVRALLARAGEKFVQDLAKRPGIDFWSVARELAKAGRIQPLASRGIVGQVTGEAVVYDAETTQGGSGGPVFSLSGEVIAVNAAIFPEFAGSNMGVPVRHAAELIAKLKLRPSE